MGGVWLEVVKGKGHLVQSLTGRASRPFTGTLKGEFTQKFFYHSLTQIFFFQSVQLRKCTPCGNTI